MQKWEYAVVIGMSIFGRDELVGDSVVFTQLTSSSQQPVDNMRQISQVLAKLGDEGWEMVACGNTGEFSHNLYFKRPKL